MRRNFVLIVLLVLSFSCGYHIEYRRKSLPDGSKKIYVEPFKNSTTTALVENYFTDAIKQEFYSKKDIKLVSKDQADVIMKGVLQSIKLDGTAFNKTIYNLEAKEYLITMTVEVKLLDKSGQVIWNKLFSEQEIFNVFENIMKDESEHRKAADRISKNMMKKVYDSIFEGFPDES